MAGTGAKDGPAPFSLPGILTGGIVAHNEVSQLRLAVRSLVEQELPQGTKWGDIWVVASGCTDGTVEVAEALANEDPRIRVVTEPDRGGKARALGEVFRRAEGDALVLLNSDARAEPGAVGQLVRTAAGKAAPFAVMARPVVPRHTFGRWAPTFRWMWDLHHEFHAELLAHGGGGHLSDELLLVSLPGIPPLPEGIINDGSYLAVWLSQNAGGRWYAPGARVSIQVPSTVQDHLHQRRRIHVGNAQVSSVLGAPPATLVRQFWERPAETTRLLRRMLARENGFQHFARLATWELASHGLAAWDRLPPRRDHVRWQRIRPQPARSGPGPIPAAEPRTGVTPTTVTERRVVALLEVADDFGTGIPLGQLGELLPADGPRTLAGVERWLGERPGLARVDGPRAYSPTASAATMSDRVERGRVYRQYAERLWSGPLAFAQELGRCAGITGSVAFGEPRPGDDLDLFVVTRSGSMWWFLARAYFALYVARRRHPELQGPTPCLNYVLEDGPASREFARRGDLLFAREALSVLVLQGDDYYRGLVASAPWMHDELPRLFKARSQAPGSVVAEPAPRLIRVLNAMAFPLLATYLQLVGLSRNSHLRHHRNGEPEFRTVTSFGRLAFASRRFERLRSRYSRASSDSTMPDARGGGGATRANPSRDDQVPSRRFDGGLAPSIAQTVTNAANHRNR